MATKDLPSLVFSCLNDARKQGWNRSDLTIRLGTAAMQRYEGDLLRLAKDTPELPLTNGLMWGCPVVPDIALPKNQVVIASPDGAVVGGAYVASE